MPSYESVLLVDDSRADNFLHKELIREAHFADHIHIAKDGVEALEYLKQGGDGGPFPPSVIFLDINMPRMDGFEFLESVREYELSSLVIVMLTTSLDPVDEERARKSGLVADFLHKPLSLAELERLKNLSRQRES